MTHGLIMNLRSLSTALATVVLLLMSCGSAGATPNQYSGTVTWCSGKAVLHRDGNSFAVVRGAGIRLRDTIESRNGTKLTVVLDDGPTVTIGGNSSIRLDHLNGTWTISLQRGLARIVHDGSTDLQVLSKDVELQPGRSIVRLASARQTRFELVAGTTRVASINDPLSEVGTYQWKDGRLRKAQPIDWGLDHSMIRLAAAMQSTPALDAPPTSNSTTNNSASGNASPPNFNQPPSPPADLDDRTRPQDTAQAAPPQATRGEGQSDNNPIRITNSATGSSSLSLGSLSSGAGSFVSGGLFGDANQQTFQGELVGQPGTTFPGAIHLVTAETRIPFDNVRLLQAEFDALFSSSSNRFYSIGTGQAPTSQVVTNFLTGSNVVPETVSIPSFDAHLVYLEQYNIPDPAQGALDNNIGLTGLLGMDPVSPVILGTTPLVDERAVLNDKATFALGEFLVTTNGPQGITFTIRRSDQDRLIVKDANGNDANDQVTTNPDVTYEDAVDPRFLPQSPTVKVPASVADRGTNIDDLHFLRRAAFTTLVADQLNDYSLRTGQTRFVIDGKIVDISGFRPTP